MEVKETMIIFGFLTVVAICITFLVALYIVKKMSSTIKTEDIASIKKMVNETEKVMRNYGV